MSLLLVIFLTICQAAILFWKLSLPAGSFMAVNADMNSTRNESTCELTASSSQNLMPDCSSLFFLREEDVA